MNTKITGTNRSPIMIGQLIEEELRHQNHGVTWLGRELNCNRRNVYDIFSRTSVDTWLLYHLNEVLHMDFFAYFSNSINNLKE